MECHDHNDRPIVATADVVDVWVSVTVDGVEVLRVSPYMAEVLAYNLGSASIEVQTHDMEGEE